jgi:acetoacetyl-CoA reductase
MLDRKSGRIVNISSFVALAGNIGQSNYATTKAGIIGFTKSVALEVARHGITVNAVCPGFTETDMLREVPEKIRERILEKIPMGRFGQPEEIATCVRYIVTEGDYMTAQAISINGGVYV